MLVTAAFGLRLVSTMDVPTRTETAPIVGETAMHMLWNLSSRREQEQQFQI